VRYPLDEDRRKSLTKGEILKEEEEKEEEAREEYPCLSLVFILPMITADNSLLSALGSCVEFYCNSRAPEPI
jgi:hypothetical protein